MSQQIEAFAEQVIDAVGGYVKKEMAVLRKEFATAVAAIPAGPKGDSGESIRGEKGDIGAKGEAGPQGEPGANGKDGEPGERGVAGERGADGVNGKDGINGKSVTVEDFRQMFDAEYAKWQLDFERRAADSTQRFLEKIPKPSDGKDGLGFDDLEMKHDGERLFTFRFVRGDQSKEFSFVIPAVIYRGIYKSGTYQAGDSVTYAGSTFIAKRETQAKPETEDWQLSSKRGRDGKDADRPDATERVVRLK